MYRRRGREVIGVGIAVGQVILNRVQNNGAIMYGGLAAVWIAVGLAASQLI